MLLHQLIHRHKPIIYAFDGEQMCKLSEVTPCGAMLKCEDGTLRLCVYHVVAKAPESDD